MNHRGKNILAQRLIHALQHYHAKVVPLPGIQGTGAADSLARQIVDSIQRVDYVYTIASRRISSASYRPNSGAFNPMRAAIWHKNSNNYEEACWLTFLSVNFGKHKTTKWKLTEEIYGANSNKAVMTWNRMNCNPNLLTNWLSNNHLILSGKFGNHRKYETLNTSKRNHTGETISSYVQWVNKFGGHRNLFQQALLQANGNPEKAFSILYQSMDDVTRFARTGKFDYLTMIAKLGLCNLEPDKAYISGATGPKKGIALLMHGNKSVSISSSKAERDIKSLSISLLIPRMRMQVMEDAICNWQKSPYIYKKFIG